MGSRYDTDNDDMDDIVARHDEGLLVLLQLTPTSFPLLSFCSEI